ncbi:MFS transporter [Gloeobacter kilaueensis]|nr:MFS transporter [Gloeobacter kilaueensis]
MLHLSRYQWTVLLAAWLGWGFDAFDGLLFNFVAPHCVPTLLGLTIGSPEASAPTLYWTGLLTSVLLLGWAAGGVLFGMLGDRIGRTKTLLLTILFYSLGTFASGFAPNIWVFTGCRIVTSLGIGGEWAAGAAMVAEVVPERRRIEAGALLYTATPMGLFLAAFVSDQFSRVILPGSPEISWRYVFFTGLIPSALAIAIRFLIKEPERWQRIEKESTAHIRELFAPHYRRRTLGGLSIAVVALLTWWNCNAFIPVIAAGLAQTAAKAQNITDGKPIQLLVEQWKTTTSYSFTAGGLLGTLLTVPVAKFLGRKWMFVIYFLLSAIAMLFTFGAKVPANLQVWSGLYFVLGLVVFGVLSSFTYYLPELFPTRLRATGAGFCYNVGRVITAAGPFLVGYAASQRANALQTTIELLFLIGFIPLVGVIISLAGWVTETKEQRLAD